MCVFYLKTSPTKIKLCVSAHLAALLYTEDLKKYGFNEILKPLIEDLNILETRGIEIPPIEEPLVGSVIQVTGDNLALSSFVESFSATHWCRFCLTRKEEIQSLFKGEFQSI